MKLLKFIGISILLIGLAAGCKPPAGEAAGESEGGQAVVEEKPEVLVRVTRLEKVSISRTLDYNATLQAFEEVYIAPAAPGRIDKIYVEPGDRVKKGQKLFLMDQTQLHQTRIQLQSLETDLKRMETLLETGSITQQAYDQMKTQYDVTSSSLDYLSDNTLMFAPFDGVITAKYYENGEIYSGAPNTQAGKACVVTLMQDNPLKAIVNISEGYYPIVKRGMHADIVTDVYPDMVFDGKTILVYPVIDEMTRSFKVEIEVPNRNRQLKPGMYARVSMLAGEETAFIVPSSTVLQQEGTNLRYIFVEENGVARRYNVIIGKRFDEKVEIISDSVTEGALLISDGQTKLMDGYRVKVVD